MSISSPTLCTAHFLCSVYYVVSKKLAQSNKIAANLNMINHSVIWSAILDKWHFTLARDTLCNINKTRNWQIVCHLLQEHSLLHHAWLGQIWKKNRHVNVYFAYDRDFTVFFITVCARDHCCHCVLCYLTHQRRTVSFVYASCWGQQSCAHWQSYLSHSLNTLDRLWGRAPVQNMCLRTAIFTHGNRRQGHAFSHGHPSGQPFGGLIALYAKH